MNRFIIGQLFFVLPCAAWLCALHAATCPNVTSKNVSCPGYTSQYIGPCTLGQHGDAAICSGGSTGVYSGNFELVWESPGQYINGYSYPDCAYVITCILKRHPKIYYWSCETKATMHSATSYSSTSCPE